MRRQLSLLWEDEDNFGGEVRVRYRIENMSVFHAFAFVLLLAHCCCLWAMVPHDVGLRAWEDEDDFRGEVRAWYGIENMSAFCAFAFVLPLAHCCYCLWAMEVLALLLHCLLTQTSFYF